MSWSLSQSQWANQFLTHNTIALPRDNKTNSYSSEPIAGDNQNGQTRTSHFICHGILLRDEDPKERSRWATRCRRNLVERGRNFVCNPKYSMNLSVCKLTHWTLGYIRTWINSGCAKKALLHCIRYRSDGLCVVNSSRKFGQAFSGGDVIGCGLAYYRNEVIFTYNGHNAARIMMTFEQDEVRSTVTLVLWGIGFSCFP